MCAQTAVDDSGASPPGAPRRPRNQITPIQWVGLGVLILLLLNQLGLFRFTSADSAVAYLINQLPRFVALILAITVHEFSHGLVATAFGDTLPRRVGRLTLNPLKHLDPLGTIMILVGPIGWGRPMPINPGEMRNPNLGWAMSSLAGPVSNIVAATVVAVLYGLLGQSGDRTLYTYVVAFIVINVLLAVFNLLPVPPLDGFGVLFGLVPLPMKLVLRPLLSYGPLILLAVLFLPPLRSFLDIFIGTGVDIIIPPIEGVCRCNILG